MKENKSKSVISQVIICILIIASVILYAIHYFTAEQPKGAGIWTIAFLASVVLALCYGTYGCTKQNHKFFRGSFIAYAIYAFLTIIFFANGSAQVAVGAAAISLCIATIYSVATDLGKTKSVVLALVFLVMPIVSLIYFAVAGGYSLVGSLAGVCIALTYVIMIFAKYTDKKARGSK